MKVVTNICYGGFELTDEMVEALHANGVFDDSILRTDPRLVKMVEAHGNPWKPCSGTMYKVVEIPDKSTDYLITNYDGIETLYYVLDGKIHAAQ